MRIMNSLFLVISMFFSGLFFSSCASNTNEKKIQDIVNYAEGLALEKNTLTLTIGAVEKLNIIPAPVKANNVNLIWETSNPDLINISQDGVVKAINFSSGGNSEFREGAATGTAIIIVRTADGKFEDSIEVTATTAALTSMDTLPPLKDRFADFFLTGNIAGAVPAGPDSEITGNGESVIIGNTRLIRHYNTLTAENHMKPSYITNGRNAATGEITWTWTNADRFVNAAENSGFNIIGHTLLWHSQIPAWQHEIGGRRGTAGNYSWNIANVMSKDEALIIMREFVNAVVSRYAGRIHTWDVLNEIFPDSVTETMDWKTAMRGIGDSQGPNPWFVAIGADFVYEGFLAARLADPNARLYYNDYNTDAADKAVLIRNMIRDVNERYRLEHGNAEHSNFGARSLIEGIGMQEHHNTGISADRIRNSINIFRELPGVTLSVTELDLLGQGWNDFRSAGGEGANQQGSSTVTNDGIMNQARLYGEYMALYLENSDIIERVSWWGVRDSQSWRSRGLPLLFDSDWNAKPAYYKVIEALENHLRE
ncbi:MAG: endo-1,4-beta-xylanase [Treponema sp.]|nr:endo-1,4-beta-xylanase [Treponema sp.]